MANPVLEQRSAPSFGGPEQSKFKSSRSQEYASKGKKKHDSLRGRLATLEPMLGVASYFPGFDNLRLLSNAGYDFVFLDWEHTAIDIKEMREHIKWVNASSDGMCTSIVRVPNSDACWTQWALEAGAGGVIVPGLKSAKDAQRIITAARMYDDSDMSGRAAKDSSSLGRPDAVVLVQVDSGASADVVDELLALPGIDGAFAALDRLFMDLKPQFSKSQLEKEFDRCESSFLSSGERNGKPIMWFARNNEHVAKRLQQGYRMIVTGIDSQIFDSACRESLLEAAGEVDKWRSSKGAGTTRPAPVMAETKEEVFYDPAMVVEEEDVQIGGVRTGGSSPTYAMWATVEDDDSVNSFDFEEYALAEEIPSPMPLEDSVAKDKQLAAQARGAKLGKRIHKERTEQRGGMNLSEVVEEGDDGRGNAYKFREEEETDADGNTFMTATEEGTDAAGNRFRMVGSTSEAVSRMRSGTVGGLGSNSAFKATGINADGNRYEVETKTQEWDEMQPSGESVRLSRVMSVEKGHSRDGARYKRAMNHGVTSDGTTFEQTTVAHRGMTPQGVAHLGWGESGAAIREEEAMEDTRAARGPEVIETTKTTDVGPSGITETTTRRVDAGRLHADDETRRMDKISTEDYDGRAPYASSGPKSLSFGRPAKVEPVHHQFTPTRTPLREETTITVRHDAEPLAEDNTFLGKRSDAYQEKQEKQEYDSGGQHIVKEKQEVDVPGAYTFTEKTIERPAGETSGSVLQTGPTTMGTEAAPAGASSGRQNQQPASSQQRAGIVKTTREIDEPGKHIVETTTVERDAGRDTKQARGMQGGTQGGLGHDDAAAAKYNETYSYEPSHGVNFGNLANTDYPNKPAFRAVPPSEGRNFGNLTNTAPTPPRQRSAADTRHPNGMDEFNSNRPHERYHKTTTERQERDGNNVVTRTYEREVIDDDGRGYNDRELRGERMYDNDYGGFRSSTDTGRSSRVVEDDDRNLSKSERKQRKKDAKRNGQKEGVVGKTEQKAKLSWLKDKQEFKDFFLHKKGSKNHPYGHEEPPTYTHDFDADRMHQDHLHDRYPREGEPGSRGTPGVGYRESHGQQGFRESQGRQGFAERTLNAPLKDPQPSRSYRTQQAGMHHVGAPVRGQTLREDIVTEGYDDDGGYFMEEERVYAPHFQEPHLHSNRAQRPSGLREEIVRKSYDSRGRPVTELTEVYGLTGGYATAGQQIRGTEEAGQGTRLLAEQNMMKQKQQQRQRQPQRQRSQDLRDDVRYEEYDNRGDEIYGEDRLDRTRSGGMREDMRASGRDNRGDRFNVDERVYDTAPRRQQQQQQGHQRSQSRGGGIVRERIVTEGFDENGERFKREEVIESREAETNGGHREYERDAPRQSSRMGHREYESDGPRQSSRMGHRSSMRDSGMREESRSVAWDDRGDRIDTMQDRYAAPSQQRMREGMHVESRPVNPNAAATELACECATCKAARIKVAKQEEARRESIRLSQEREEENQQTEEWVQQTVEYSGPEQGTTVRRSLESGVAPAPGQTYTYATPAAVGAPVGTREIKVKKVIKKGPWPNRIPGMDEKVNVPSRNKNNGNEQPRYEVKSTEVIPDPDPLVAEQGGTALLVESDHIVSAPSARSAAAAAVSHDQVRQEEDTLNPPGREVEIEQVMALPGTDLMSPPHERIERAQGDYVDRRDSVAVEEGAWEGSPRTRSSRRHSTGGRQDYHDGGVRERRGSQVTRETVTTREHVVEEPLYPASPVRRTRTSISESQTPTRYRTVVKEIPVEPHYNTRYVERPVYTTTITSPKRQSNRLSLRPLDELIDPADTPERTYGPLSRDRPNKEAKPRKEKKKDKKRRQSESRNRTSVEVINPRPLERGDHIDEVQTFIIDEDTQHVPGQPPLTTIRKYVVDEEVDQPTRAYELDNDDDFVYANRNARQRRGSRGSRTFGSGSGSGQGAGPSRTSGERFERTRPQRELTPIPGAGGRLQPVRPELVHQCSSEFAAANRRFYGNNQSTGAYGGVY